MLRTARSPARQLGSVCARFHNPLALLAEKAGGPQCRLRRHSSEPDGRQSGSSPQQLRRLEAVLMLAREPLSSRKLSQFAGLADGTQARTLVRRLNSFYDEVSRAFRVEEVAGGFQLLTRPKFAPWLRRLGHVPPEIRLSSPAMETLAVVAYRQPVLRADIEAIRGVNCGEILRQLMERDLVRIGGRSEELGRPYLYTTTGALDGRSPCTTDDKRRRSTPQFDPDRRRFPAKANRGRSLT
jgi:segregation and condensation protein B